MQWGRAATVSLLASVFVLALLIMIGLSSVNADTYGSPYAGAHPWRQLHMAEDGQISFSVSGDTTFDVYIATMENAFKLGNNESFAYIQEMSFTNVTHADVSGKLPHGDYGIIFYFRGPGNITISDIHQSYGTSVPWDAIAMITITAVVSVAGTYIFMRGRMTKK